jgi:hypothetical protein
MQTENAVSCATESGTTDVLKEAELDNPIQFQATGAGYARFDLSAIDARAGTHRNDRFNCRAAGPFQSKGGEIRLMEEDDNTVVSLNNEVGAAVEMVILVTGTIGLTVENFIL